MQQAQAQQQHAQQAQAQQQVQLAQQQAQQPQQQPQQPQQRPDGDVELAGMERGFRVPPCPACGGILKPYVVFFGDGEL